MCEKTPKDCCHTCGEKLQYSMKYDANFCAECGVWKDDMCDSEDCEYCIKRPEKPHVEKS